MQDIGLFCRISETFSGFPGMKKAPSVKQVPINNIKFFQYRSSISTGFAEPLCYTGTVAVPDSGNRGEVKCMDLHQCFLSVLAGILANYIYWWLTRK